MFHLLAWSGAKTDSTANEQIPAVADLTATRTANANQYLCPFDATIAYAAAFNDTITRARANYPSYRDLGLPEIFPLVATAVPSASFHVCKWGVNGPRVRKGEELGVDASNGASTVDVAHACLGLMDGVTPIPPGRRFTVRGTSTITLVASAWTPGVVALDQTLPYGRYGVIGMEASCTNGVFARLAFPGNQNFRPGVVCGASIAVLDFRQATRNGELGLLGTFDQTAPPQVEVLAGTAGAQTVAVILDLVEISRGQN